MSVVALHASAVWQLIVYIALGVALRARIDAAVGGSETGATSGLARDVSGCVGTWHWTMAATH